MREDVFSDKTGDFQGLITGCSAQVVLPLPSHHVDSKAVLDSRTTNAG